MCCSVTTLHAPWPSTGVLCFDSPYLVGISLHLVGQFSLQEGLQADMDTLLNYGKFLLPQLPLIRWKLKLLYGMCTQEHDICQDADLKKLTVSVGHRILVTWKLGVITLASIFFQYSGIIICLCLYEDSPVPMSLPCSWLIRIQLLYWSKSKILWLLVLLKSSILTIKQSKK